MSLITTGRPKSDRKTGIPPGPVRRDKRVHRQKSDFSADGYYDGSNETEDAVADMDTGKGSGEGGYQFTEQEQAELDKKLPYASSEAVIKLMQADKWLTYSTDMELVSSDLYKVSFTGKDKYYYTANFSSYVPDENDYVYEEIVEEDGSVSVPAVESAQNWQEVNITVDAESGQIMSYYFWDTRDSRSSSYDLDKADKLAEEIAKTYAAAALWNTRAILPLITPGQTRTTKHSITEAAIPGTDTPATYWSAEIPSA